MKIKEEIKNIIYCKKGYENYHYLFISFFIAIIILNPVQIVSAETGSILVEDMKVQSYTLSSVAWSGAVASWNTIKYDSANYNKIDSFHYHDVSGIIAFAHDFEGTYFTISNGGIGNGYAWYDKNASAVYYTFSNDAIFTSSPLTLSFTKNVLNNVTFTYSRYADTAVVPTSTQPICVKHPIDRCMAGTYHSVTTALEATDTYNITYLSSNLFSLSIDKNNLINTKYIIHGYISEYSREAEFNKIDIDNAIFIYNDGLYLNMTLSSGIYSEKLINSTVISGYQAPIFNISFNKSYYNLGEQTNISYTMGNMDLTNNFYRIKVFNANDMLNAEYTSPNIVSSSGFVLPAIFDKTIPTGFYAKLYSYAYSDASTYYVNKILLSESFVSYGVNISNIIGNISTDKSSYNTTETITIKYNTTVDGRIRIRDGLTNFWFIPIIAGNNQEKTFYISVDDNIGTWQLLLQYYLGTWDTINSTSCIVNAHVSRIDFDKDIYNIGDTMNIISFSNVTGYISLFDSDNILRSNYTVNTGITTNTYYLQQSSSSGTWIINLYDTSGNLLSYDNALVQFDIIPEITYTPIPTVQTLEEKGLIDIGNQIGIIILGNVDTDNSGDYSDSEVIKTGNKIFLTIFVIALFLLLGGSYNYLTKKR